MFHRIHHSLQKILYNRTLWFGGSALILLLYVLPYFLLGENFPVAVHDNLDSNVIWVKLFLQSGSCFSLERTKVMEVMNGVSATSLYGSIDLSLLFFKLLGTYWGYVANKVIMAVVAFIGMYFLLKKHVLKEDVFMPVQFGVAVIFAMLPFWSFTISVAGLPLLLFSFLNIRQKISRYWDWLIIILFAFYSSLIFSGFFFLLLVSAILLYDWWRTRAFNAPFFRAIVVLSLSYILSHFWLFYSFLLKHGYTTHRVEMTKEALGFSQSFKNAYNMFFSGQYHTHSLHLYILFSALLGLIFIGRYMEWRKKFFLISAFIVSTSLFFGFINWSGLSSFFNALSSFVPVQLQRFHTLHPMLWYVLFAISLAVILRRFNFGIYIVLVLLLLQFVYVAKRGEFMANRSQPSFKNFYAEDIFTEVKKFIGKDPSEFRVVCLGFHPAVAQYNNFCTLDGYVADYSLEYKHEFRKLIKGELDKDEKLKRYFDNWGSRCYAFSAELQLKKFMYGKSNTKQIEHYDLDVDAFHSMGGRYLLSSVRINEHENTRFHLLKAFETPSSYWKIYLYEAI